MNWTTFTNWVLGIIIAFSIVTLAFFFFAPEQPIQLVKARVTGVSEKPVDLRDGIVQKVTISLRTQDGHAGQSTLPLSMLACKVGDTVDAQRQGLSLSLAGGACRVQH